MAIGIQGAGVGGRSFQISDVLLKKMQTLLASYQDTAVQEKTDTLVVGILKGLMGASTQNGLSDTQVKALSHQLAELGDTLKQGVASGEYDGSVLTKFLDTFSNIDRDEDTRKKTGGLFVPPPPLGQSPTHFVSVSDASKSIKEAPAAKKSASANLEDSSKTVKKVNSILSGGVDNLGELRDLMDLVGSPDIDSSLMELISKAITEFVQTQAKQCTNLQQFKEFVSTVVGITRGHTGGGVDFLDVVTQALADVADEVAGNLGIEKSKVTDIIGGASGIDQKTNNGTNNREGRDSLLGDSQLRDEPDAPTATSPSSPYMLSTTYLAQQPSRVDGVSADNKVLPKRFSTASFQQNFSKNPDETITKILEALEVILSNRSETALNNVEFPDLG